MKCDACKKGDVGNGGIDKALRMQFVLADGSVAALNLCFDCRDKVIRTLKLDVEVPDGGN